MISAPTAAARQARHDTPWRLQVVRASVPSRLLSSTEQLLKPQQPLETTLNNHATFLNAPLFD